MRVSSVTPTPSSLIQNYQIKRGATPTGQIVRGKPPTPPPARLDKERSRSPTQSPVMINQQQRRQSSNLTPSKLTATKKNYILELNSGVSPNVAALRNSIYQSERNRMGITNDDSKESNFNTNENFQSQYNGEHESDNTDNENYVDDDNAELSGGEFDHLKYLIQVYNFFFNKIAANNYNLINKK